MQQLVEPLVVSWGWEPERTNLLNLDGTASRFVLENEWQGTRDPAAYLSVPEAIQFQAEHDWPRVRAECHELLREARRRIEALTDLPPICPDSPEWFAQMAASPRCRPVMGRRSSGGCTTSTTSKCRSSSGVGGSWCGCRCRGTTRRRM